MTKKKINGEWIKETREYFRNFLDETGFPDPEWYGERGPKFTYPEWLIMFIGLVAVKMKIKRYLELHRFIKEHWNNIGGDLGYKEIPEATMRYRLKKICFKFGTTPAYIVSMFPKSFYEK